VGVDTLKYLIKIGRAPKTAANFGEFLHVKPIVGFVDDTGLLDMVARVRGKRKQLMKLVDLVNKYIDTTESIHAMIHYADGRDAGEELKEMITNRYNCSEIYVTQFSPVMISALGHAVGLSFYS
jgi:DegV family protein with EDD domain